MIIFEGELSESCKNKLHKKQKVTAITVGVILLLGLGLPIVIFAVVWSKYALCFLGVVVPISICDPIMDKKLHFYPNRIIVYDDMIESYKDDKCIVAMYTADIKKVVDFGDGYDIVFYFPKRNNSYILQKNLIVQGSIEKFEEIFNEKLIRAKV